MKKNTKIVATIGPATESKEILAELIKAGMNVARFNTKHSTPEWHNERIKRVKQVSEELDMPVSVLLDLQGPEVRINLPGEDDFNVEKGDVVVFTSDEKFDAPNLIFIPQDVVESMSEDNEVLLDDGACEFVVTKKGAVYFEAKAKRACKVGHRKTMNTPGVILDMPSLTDRDFVYLEGVDGKLVDFVGLSFVRDAKDIEILKKELKKQGYKADIVSKIENQAALDNLDEIIEASEAIMIARGDLGVEVDYQELTYWQKSMINKCRMAAKPVITATQMLKSMVSSPRPTRAEVSDVAHAIYDGTDAVMLSEETTIGEFPVEAVTTQTRIAEFNEPHRSYFLPNETTQSDSSSCIAHASMDILFNSNIQIDKVICITETGRTARLLSRFRPGTPIFAATSNEKTANKLTLVYGVQPFVIDIKDSELEEKGNLLEKLKEKGIVKKGDSVLLVYATFWKKPGLTNTMTIMQVH